MPYEITYEPVNRIAGVAAKTVTKETAAEALKLVEALNRSDAKTTVKDTLGYYIGLEELSRLAAKETN